MHGLFHISERFFDYKTTNGAGNGFSFQEHSLLLFSFYVIKMNRIFKLLTYVTTEKFKFPKCTYAKNDELTIKYDFH